MSDQNTNPRRNSSEESPPRQFELISPGMPADPRIMTQNDKDQLIHVLRTRKVKTITELRRIERVFADMDVAEVTEPMTSAWRYYVDSNNMLNELRGLTTTYPFSSECLDEAKRLVLADPNSSRSWNFCWLILHMIQNRNLIIKHARALASRPSTWGGTLPIAADADRLVAACSDEWNRALRQMLRHWEKPPTVTGR